MGLWHKTRRCNRRSGCETDPSRSQQVGESGCQTLAPAYDLALFLGFKKWIEDLVSAGSHNQQHLRTVLCNAS